jgi:hypothetical protein
MRGKTKAGVLLLRTRDKARQRPRHEGNAAPSLLWKIVSPVTRLTRTHYSSPEQDDESVISTPSISVRHPLEARSVRDIHLRN